MKIPSPHPQLTNLKAQVLLANGDSFTMQAGNDFTFEVDDDAIEVLATAFDNQGRTAQHAWTKENGVQSMDLYLENKKLKQKVAAYEAAQKEKTRKIMSESKAKQEKKNEAVPTPRPVQSKKAED